MVENQNLVLLTMKTMEIANRINDLGSKTWTFWPGNFGTT